MQAMRESWTDARLDDFRGEVDSRFGDVSDGLDRVESEIRELRSEMKSSFESINRTMLHGVIALYAAYIAGFAVIVTQL
jgi:hypothetical protein